MQRCAWNRQSRTSARLLRGRRDRRAASAVRAEFTGGGADGPGRARRGTRRRVLVSLAAAGIAITAAVPAWGGTPAAGASAAASSSGTVGRLKFADEFGGVSINRSAWSIYQNKGGGDVRLSGNIVVRDGLATLRTVYNSALHRWTFAGMCACGPSTQIYGRYEVRVRVSAGDSRVVALLWPAHGWPPEIDFMEMGAKDDGRTRQRSTQTLHYGNRADQHMIHTNYRADMTKWHVVGVDWQPGVLQYLLDGKVMNTIRSPHVPTVPMWLGMQTAPASHFAPTRPATMQVDWVHVYARS